MTTPLPGWRVLPPLDVSLMDRHEAAEYREQEQALRDQYRRARWAEQDVLDAVAGGQPTQEQEQLLARLHAYLWAPDGAWERLGRPPALRLAEEHLVDGRMVRLPGAAGPDRR